jgi:hypothetical protein
VDLSRRFFGRRGSALVSSYLWWGLIKALIIQGFMNTSVVIDIRFNSKKSPKNQKGSLTHYDLASGFAA